MWPQRALFRIKFPQDASWTLTLYLPLWGFKRKLSVYNIKEQTQSSRKSLVCTSFIYNLNFQLAQLDKKFIWIRASFGWKACKDKDILDLVIKKLKGTSIQASDKVKERMTKRLNVLSSFTTFIKDELWTQLMSNQMTKQLNLCHLLQAPAFNITFLVSPFHESWCFQAQIQLIAV